MSLFQTIIVKKEIHLKDICDIESAIIKLMNMKNKYFDGKVINMNFPFEKDFVSIYSKIISNQFEKDKESLIELINSDTLEGQQVFETEVTILEDTGFIRYMFPVAYAESIIKQVGLKKVEISVESLYEYSKVVDVDFQYKVQNNKPIILLDYPYSDPGFFIIDGNHRVTEAYNNHRKIQEAYLLRESAIPLISAQPIFSLLAKIHRNLHFIALYYIEQINLNDLKQVYQNIGDEKWLL